MSDRHGVGLVGTRPDQRAASRRVRAALPTGSRSSRSAIPTPARAQSVAHELGARAYTDLDDLLADDRVVSVDLALPHHVHFPAARAALAAGKHVLVEKPLSPTSDECRALIEQAEAAGLSLGVAENTRFVAAYQAVARLVSAGAIGEPRLVRTLISRQRGAPPQRSDAVEGPPGRVWRRGDHRRRPALVLPASLARRRARHGARVPPPARARERGRRPRGGRRALRLGRALHHRVHVHRRDPVGRAARALRERGIDHRRPAVAHARAALPRRRRSRRHAPRRSRVRPTRLEGRLDRGRRGGLRRLRARGPAADRVAAPTGCTASTSPSARTRRRPRAASSSRSTTEGPPDERPAGVRDRCLAVPRPSGTRPLRERLAGAHGVLGQSAIAVRRARASRRPRVRPRPLGRRHASRHGPGRDRARALHDRRDALVGRRSRVDRDAPPLGRARALRAPCRRRLVRGLG